MIAFVSLKMFTWIASCRRRQMAEIFYKVTQQKTDRGLDTKNWSRFVLKIARDYAENAPKAFVIYRFRNEHDVFFFAAKLS